MVEAIAVAVGVLLLAALAVVIWTAPSRKWRFQIDEELSEDQFSDGEDAYPRIPGGSAKPPNWLLNEPEQPYELKAFFAPIPHELNAATDYLTALVEFGGEMPVCFPKEQQAELKAKADERIAKFNAVFNAENWPPIISTDQAAVDEVLALFEPGFEKMFLAQQKSRCVFATLGSMVNNLWPHLFACRQVAAVAHLRNARDCERREFTRPIQTIEMILRLARDIQFRGFLFSQIVAIAILRIVQGLAVRFLDDPHLTRSHVDHLIRVLRNHERQALSCPYAEGLRAEYVLARGNFHEIEHRTGIASLQGLQQMGRIYVSKFRSIGAMLAWTCDINNVQLRAYPTPRRTADYYDARIRRLKAGDHQREAQLLSQFTREYIAVAELPLPQQAERHGKLLELRSRGVLLPALSGVYPHFGKVFVRGSAATRVSLCLAAVRRWQLEHSTMPPDLATALQTIGVESVPLDPFTNLPLRMELIENKPVIRAADPDEIIKPNDTTSTTILSTSRDLQ